MDIWRSSPAAALSRKAACPLAGSERNATIAFSTEWPGIDVLESLTVGAAAQHFFQVLSRGGGPLVQTFIRALRQIFFNV